MSGFSAVWKTWAQVGEWLIQPSAIANRTGIASTTADRPMLGPLVGTTGAADASRSQAEESGSQMSGRSSGIIPANFSRASFSATPDMSAVTCTVTQWPRTSRGAAMYADASARTVSAFSSDVRMLTAVHGFAPGFAAGWSAGNGDPAFGCAEAAAVGEPPEDACCTPTPMRTPATTTAL